MKYVADLHIHSHFSRATSKQLNLEHLSKWAQLKGIQIVGTGDFVHPGWMEELKQKLEPAEEGLYKLKPEYARATQDEVPAACQGPVRFMLTAEISNIYKKMDRVRKIHNVVFAPNFEVAETIQARLDAIGNIRSDGRPILGLDSRDLLEITLEAGPMAFLVPAHIWTPWFSALGSKGGFDRIEDCFGDLTSHIFAVETGLSSDPPMNWRLKQLDPFVLVSNSDAHSPQKLAREATIFDTEFSYPGLYRALSDPVDRGLLGTIEFFPEEGKYHYDGHRKCGVRLHPRETLANKGLCPKCGKPVTVGVMARVEELADRPEGEKPPRWRPYYSLVPLPEVIAEAKNVGAGSKAVQSLFLQMLTKLGNELYILMDAPLEEISKVAGSVIAEGIRRMREGEVYIAAGYDGEYGVVRIFDDAERADIHKQFTFFAEEETKAVRQQPEEAPSRDKPKPKTEPASPKQEPEPPEPGMVGTDIERAAAMDEEGETYLPPESRSLQAADIQLGMQLPEDLNSAQWRAVTHTGGHLLIVAGPGTGKTHTLTYRIAHVVQCFAPGDRILAITFTNRAAEEMHERLQKRLGEDARGITVGTFHSFCLQLLRRFIKQTELPAGFRLASPDEVEAVAAELWPELSAAERNRRLEEIGRWKATGQLADAPEPVAQYNHALRQRGLLDFDDLLLESVRLLSEQKTVRDELRQRYRYIFVDEYQDLNAVQHELLKWLVGDGVQLTAIGDPNQAIYGFRGSDVRFFGQFETDFPGAKVLHLSENYRSASHLLDASSQVIRRDALPGIPPLTAKMYAEGQLVIYEAPTEKAEAEYIVHQIEKLVGGTSMFSQDSGRVESEEEAQRSFGDIAVLYRLNQQRSHLEEALSRHGIPYRVSGDRPLIAREGVREILTLVQLAHDQPISPGEVARLLQFAAEHVGPKTADAIRAQLEAAPARPLTWETVKPSLESMTGLPQPAIQGASRFLAETEEFRHKLQTAGLMMALQHLYLLDGWRRVLSAKDDRHESWQRLVRIARLHPALPDFLDYILLQKETDAGNEAAERVALMTLHAAKGLEFPVVFIVGCEEKLLPLDLAGMRSDPAEERRLFYVAMTRAKEQLFLVRSKKRSLFGKSYKTSPSRFLMDIEEELKQYEKTRMPARKKKPAPASNQMELF